MRAISSSFIVDDEQGRLLLPASGFRLASPVCAPGCGIASGRQVLDLLDRLHGEGITLLVVTHDPGVARRAERVLVMTDGRVAKRLLPAELGPGLGGAA